MERRIFKLLTENYTEADVFKQDFYDVNATGEVVKPTVKDKEQKPETKDKLKVKECYVETTAPIQDPFVYLASSFTLKQFFDYYSIVRDIQIEFGAFMSPENNHAFTEAYNRLTQEFKQGIITFADYKDKINNELKVQVLPQRKSVLS